MAHNNTSQAFGPSRDLRRCISMAGNYAGDIAYKPDHRSTYYLLPVGRRTGNAVDPPQVDTEKESYHLRLFRSLFYRFYTTQFLSPLPPTFTDTVKAS